MKTKFVMRTASVSFMFAYLAACSPAQTASPEQLTTLPRASSPAVVEVCNTCGVVQSITPITQGGGTTGTGAVIGAVVGGVAGNQVGGGSGQKIATAAGVIGGALLGNNIEENRNVSTRYDIAIAMQDGSQRIISVQNPGSFSPGLAVNVIGDSISLR